MSCTEILKVRVSSEIKFQAKAIADRDFLTEAAWLKRLVIREIRACDAANDAGRELGRGDEVGRPNREARGMRPATYVSVLTRSHLRSLTPLPKEEFLALKRSIGELASIGRNINQIAKAANEGSQLPASLGAGVWGGGQVL